MNTMDFNVSDNIIVTIMDKNGNIVKDEVNKKNSINHMQSKFQDGYGISLKNQCFTCDDKRLFSFFDSKDDVNAGDKYEDVTNMISAFDNIELEDASTTAFAAVQDNDSAVDLELVAENEQEQNVLFLNEDSFNITVNNYAGKSYMIKINGNNSIKKVMIKIQSEYNIPLNQQCFTCFDSGTVSDEFWEKEEEKACCEMNECREDIACLISAVENLEDVVDNDSGNEKENVHSSNEENCLTVEFMHAIDDSTCFADGNKIKITTTSQKLYLNDQLHATKNSAYSCPTAISSMIPIIAKCELETLHLYKQDLSWKEYQFLTASGTIQCLIIHLCAIQYDGNSTVTADKLFAHLPNLSKFDLLCSSKSSLFQPNTVTEIVNILPRLSKLQYFGLSGLTESFDISAFTNFVMNNTTIDIRLGFGVKLSAAYEQLLDNFIRKLISNSPKRVPRLQFPGVDEAKYSKYHKVYQHQK